jgi:hypothetical protein
VKADLLGSRDTVVFLPGFGGAVAATGEKPVEHREVNRPLQIEAVFASSCQIPHDLPQAHTLPEPTEDQIRPDLGDGHRLGFPAVWASRTFTLRANRKPLRSKLSSCPLSCMTSSLPSVAMIS